jgi:hypothetical protein
MISYGDKDKEERDNLLTRLIVHSWACANMAETWQNKMVK